MWYVYLLPLRNGDTYVGFTSNLRRRIVEHTNGHVISTSRLRPAVLSAYIAVEAEATARELESYFKCGSGRAFATKRLLKPLTNNHRSATTPDRTDIKHDLSRNNIT